MNDVEFWDMKAVDLPKTAGDERFQFLQPLETKHYLQLA